ncbi:MAG: hypothetical protein H0U76_30700 [Ktedonobacteraceae bacterium]|nr:hypothetical protein [Ktedonobacteraceae bacterium]
MTTTIPFSKQLSEQWLLDGTYHAQLRNGSELSVPDLTKAMEQLVDFPILPSSQSSTSKLPEIVSGKRSHTFFVPISAWNEVSLKEAQAIYQQGIPLLLYGQHAWAHSKEAFTAWGANKNISKIIYGDASEEPEAVSGIEYAVCYLDLNRGAFSNTSWREWFPSDTATIFDGSAPITFFRPLIEFPYTTHYTVIGADGQVHEYADRDAAVEGFSTLPSQETHDENGSQTILPHFYYYHEVKFPSGSRRIGFFGSQNEGKGEQ